MLTSERLLKQTISNELIKNHTLQFTEMLEGHRHFVEEMEKNFIDLDHRAETKIRIWKKRVEEIQEEYSLRPSRNQDIRKIESLEGELKLGTNQLKYLLMEVINQEPLYNRIFI